jgi:hypothetical protein
MKKLALAGVAAILLGTSAMVPQAEARCWPPPAICRAN